MLFVNFKTYKEGTGAQAVNLLQILNSVQGETGVPIIPVVQVADARLCVNTSSSASGVWVGHVDAVEYGQHTGWILPEAVAAQGVRGTFLNHSEHKIDVTCVTSHVSRCQQTGLETLVFASDLEELGQVVLARPTYVAYEPPELIASQTTSVAKAQPEIIKEAVEIAKKAGVPLIVGAGVKSGEDVRTSLRLGAVGVAVSSAVVLAEDPRKVLMELAEGFNK